MPHISLIILTLAVTSFIGPAWCADTPATNVRERYSEHLNDPQVAKFFAELAKDGRLWESRCSN
jgi:hypothetical protein